MHTSLADLDKASIVIVVIIKINISTFDLINKLYSLGYGMTIMSILYQITMF